MRKTDIISAHAAGTPLYYSRSGDWATYGEYHGTRVVVADNIPGHWRYDYENKKWERKERASIMHRSRTTEGFLVRNAQTGDEFVARSVELRGEWASCQDTAADNRAAMINLEAQRVQKRQENEERRTALREEFGVATWRYDDAAGTVSLDTKTLLGILRTLRDDA